MRKFLDFYKHCPECKKKQKEVELTTIIWSELDRGRKICPECGLELEAPEQEDII